MKTLICNCNKDLLFDDEDYPRLVAYTFDCQFRKGVRINDGSLRTLSEVVMQNKLEKGFMYDHKNRNNHDFQKTNLRIATNQQNVFNSKPQLDKKYKGVYFDGRKSVGHKHWRALIVVHGARISLGNYLTAEEAAIVYNNAAIKHFGEFAYLNTIDEYITA